MDNQLRAPSRSPEGSLEVLEVGLWFYRNSNLLGRGIRLFRNHYTHVSMRVDTCVYDQRIDAPSGWHPLDFWTTERPPVAKVEWLLQMDLSKINLVAPVGQRVELRATAREFFNHPVYPMARNCLSAPRDLLRYTGRYTDAVSPDQLYEQVLDLSGSLQRATGVCRRDALPPPKY